MAEQRKLIDFEKARKSVMEILAGKVTTPIAVKVAMAMQEQSVDAVEVVRCKDCKEWEYDENFSGWCNMWRRRTHGNHFCSYGERK